MLKLHLTPYTDLTNWRWNGTHYLTDDRRSRLTPYAHPLIEHLAATDGYRTLLVVRERVTGRETCEPTMRHISAGEYDKARLLADQWPADYVVIETFPDQPVQVTAGACRTTPLYLAHDGRSVHGSWDMADLREHARSLNPKEAARLLLYRPRYSSDTLFRGIHRLTERATAHFGGHLHIRYPEPALHSGPRELAEDADVLGAFTGAIDTALEQRPWQPESTVFHLTGGFDSGTVATRAAQQHPGQLATATLLIGGPGRPQQIRRRKEIRGSVPFGDRDTLTDAMAHLPLAPACARLRGEAVSPYEEPLHHPFAQLTRTLAEHGAQALVTGLGGDEMVALGQHEYPHRAMGDISELPQLPWIGPRAQATLE